MPNLIASEELTRWRLGQKRQACEILGIAPSAVRLRLLTRDNPYYMLGLFGYAEQPNCIWTRPKTGLVTYVHEMLHLLFPRAEHWWIFGASYILADRPDLRDPFNSECAARLDAVHGTVNSKEVLKCGAQEAARERGLA